jgi:hypothetical protein
MAPPVAQTGRGRRSFRIPLREVLAVAACIALLLTVFVPGVADMRGRAQRAMCAGHLGSIFRGMRLYQEAFDGSLPYAGRVANAPWLPTAAVSGQPYASNSRHMYLLVKLSYGPTPEDFICPAVRGARPMRADELAAYVDFPSIRNNSYDSLNLAGDRPNLRPRLPIAYAGDANPLFRNGRFDETIDANSANSFAHGGKGQAIVTLDGSARWMTTPIYGAKRDNLWLVSDIRHYSGTESPTREDDAQLVPGYPTTDPTVRAFLAR